MYCWFSPRTPGRNRGRCGHRRERLSHALGADGLRHRRRSNRAPVGSGHDAAARTRCLRTIASRAHAGSRHARVPGTPPRRGRPPPGFFLPGGLTPRDGDISGIPRSRARGARSASRRATPSARCSATPSCAIPRRCPLRCHGEPERTAARSAGRWTPLRLSQLIDCSALDTGPVGT